MVDRFDGEPREWSAGIPQKSKLAEQEKQASRDFSKKLLTMEAQVRESLASPEDMRMMSMDTLQTLRALDEAVIAYIAPTEGTGFSVKSSWLDVRNARVAKLLEAAQQAAEGLNPAGDKLDLALKNTLRPGVEDFVRAAINYKNKLEEKKQETQRTLEVA